MMSQVIRRETIVFLMAVGHGALLSLAYDLLRVLRRIVPHGVVSVSAEDFLFWMAAGFLTFLFLFLETDGEIRGYVAVGIGLGTALYLMCFSRLVILSLTAVFRAIQRILSFLCRPFVVLGQKTGEKIQMIKKRIEFFVERGYNKRKRTGKRRRKARVHRYRQYGRGNSDESEKKRLRRQRQPDRYAGDRRRGGFSAGRIDGAEPEADRKK